MPEASTATHLTRYVPIERLRNCDYAEIRPGELFLWPSSSSGGQLGLMVHTLDQDKTIHLPIWLTDESGHLAAPAFENVNGAGTACICLGHEYQFLVDPLDRQHQLNIMLEQTDGTGLSIINNKLAIRARPNVSRGYRRHIYAYGYTGSLIPDHELRVHTAVFLSWTLVLRDASSADGYICLGTYRPTASKT